MNPEDIPRKNLDSEIFLKLRQSTEKIAKVLFTRLRGHLDTLKSLFFPPRLLGAYIKTANMQDVAGSDKAFAELQERYAALNSKSFGLSPKLQHPLSPISSHLEITPFQYPIFCGGLQDKKIIVTSPVRWIVSYQSGCPLSRFKAMLSGAEARQDDEIKRCICDHLVFELFLEHYPSLVKLLGDLRYQVEKAHLSDLGDLPVMVVNTSLSTFLPPDSFILQVTQLSGIPAFQEIIDLEELDNFSDPLKELLKDIIKQAD